MTPAQIKRQLRTAIESSLDMAEFETLLRETLREYAAEQSADGWTREAEQASMIAGSLKQHKVTR